MRWGIPLFLAALAGCSDSAVVHGPPVIVCDREASLEETLDMQNALHSALSEAGYNVYRPFRNDDPNDSDYLNATTDIFNIHATNSFVSDGSLHIVVYRLRDVPESELSDEALLESVRVFMAPLEICAPRMRTPDGGNSTD